MLQTLIKIKGVKEKKLEEKKSIEKQSKENKIMGYDDVIPLLGGFGKYQKRIYFLVCLPAISCAFHKLAGVFLLAKPEHRCMLPFENSTSNYQFSNDVMEHIYPFDTKLNKYDSCQHYNLNFTGITSIDDILNTTRLSDNTVKCTSWIYNTPRNQTSTVTEWDLVCDRSWLAANSDSLFMLGVMLGSIVFGDLSDRYGRRPIFFASLVIQVIFGILAGVAPEYITYTISRIVIGATTSGVFLVAYVLALEMVGPKARLNAGMIIMMFFSLGYVLMAPIAYFIVQWRYLQMALTLPGLAFLCYWWFIPESARWLLSKGYKQKAIDNIQKAAKVNQVNITNTDLETVLEGDIPTDKKTDDDIPKKQASLLDIFKNPNLRRKAFFIFFDWFVVSGVYYGLSWNTNNLGGNPYFNFLVAGAVEFPAYTFLIFTLDIWGRRLLLCGTMILAGIFLILPVAVPASLGWLTVTLAMLGKLAITSSYGTIYIFSAEQFPTVVRNVGMGAASTAARVGGILAPFSLLLVDVWQPLPLIIFGILSLLGGVLSSSLPETHNKKLPETIEDGEAFGKKNERQLDDPVHPSELRGLTNNENGVNGVVTNRKSNSEHDNGDKY